MFYVVNPTTEKHRCTIIRRAQTTILSTSPLQSSQVPSEIGSVKGHMDRLITREQNGYNIGKELESIAIENLYDKRNLELHYYIERKLIRSSLKPSTSHPKHKEDCSGIKRHFLPSHHAVRSRHLIGHFEGSAAWS